MSGYTVESYIFFSSEYYYTPPKRKRFRAGTKVALEDWQVIKKIHEKIYNETGIRAPKESIELVSYEFDAMRGGVIIIHTVNFESKADAVTWKLNQ